MDMGDPDGARSILEEVLQEGNPTQKQEANRLLESIR
jgi:pilus assembly protein FimV